jgi:hypothetical protein
LQDAVTAAMDALKHIEGDAQDTVYVLKELEAIKQRITTATRTLQQAQSLVEAQRNIEGAFAGGDVVVMADTIDQMVASLEALRGAKVDVNIKGVGSIQGQDADAGIAVLQQRLEELVEPQLEAALASNSTEKVADLVVVFRKIDKMEAFRARYFSKRQALLLGPWAAWDEALAERGVGPPPSADEFLTWLAGFYDQVLTVLGEELKC